MDGARSGGDYRLDDQVGFLLRLASQRHGIIFQRLMLDGLTPTQFATLIRVAEEGEISQNHLGRLAAMDVATIKGVVDRLKRKGLLQTRQDPDDKRRTSISLTEEGQRMIGALIPTGHTISDETLEPLTGEERETLIRLLRKIT